ncbi:MULE domain-containing protein [Aphis craccivora]|uniref:MULE domain-containing protein n=1 Tax=Aphis craccivora TaxID=307492 RepID=A0A6G0ZF28_APHCR|nr:MULE domain-containing protein [Aphis craccivora]
MWTASISRDWIRLSCKSTYRSILYAEQDTLTVDVFHLTQSWWQHIQIFGLSIEYKNPKSEIGQWLKWIFGLP